MKCGFLLTLPCNGQVKPGAFLSSFSIKYTNRESPLNDISLKNPHSVYQAEEFLALLQKIKNGYILFFS